MSGQLDLPIPEPKQKGSWGGARKGAGRKKSGTRRDPLHRKRPSVSRHEPRHIVLRMVKGVSRLRKGKIYHALRHSLRRLLGDLSFRIIHVSIQGNHLHLIVEAGNKRALRRGLQAFMISAARQINKVLRRKGKVFAYRYHATPITSPKQMRNVLCYVLNNWRRHNEDEGNLASRFAAIDPYSTARQFKGWKEASLAKMPPGFRSFVPLEVAEPRSWLLKVGWQKHGPISVTERPGPI